MTEGRCPSCGAPVQFSAGTARIVICASCSTVVARTDGQLEGHGQALPITDTDSPVSVGLAGTYRGSGFRVVGRLQKDHGRGPWDEWYLAFDDGREGWLSESEGEWHLMFGAGRTHEYKLSALRPMSRITIGARIFTVEEIGQSRTVTAEGQLPSDLDTESYQHYLDATGIKGTFATLDYGRTDDLAEIFVGTVVELSELGFDPNELRPRAKYIKLQQARCTQCNGPLELKAPDQAMRVACPYCNALLDVTGGKLSFLQQLKKPEHAPFIPLGTKGKLNGVEWTCLAFLIRSCVVDGRRYPWDEYLLWNKEKGFRWLMQQNGHWIFLTPIPAGEVVVRMGGGSAEYGNRSFKAFQRVGATTEYVLGECYWAVEPGEFATAVEYIAPPYSLNSDGNEREITWTYGEYLPGKVIADAFKLKRTTSTFGTAPSEPNPYAARAKDGFKWGGIYAAAVFILYFVFSAMSGEKVVYQGALTVPAGAASGTPESMVFSEPFEVPKNDGLAVRVGATPLDNSWAGIELDLVNEQSGEVVATYGEMSYYHGYDSDGSWSEGSDHETKYVSQVDPGRYVLRMVPYFPQAPGTLAAAATGALPPAYSVWIATDAPHFTAVFVVWLLLFAWPVFNAFRASSFETARWEDSNLE